MTEIEILKAEKKQLQEKVEELEIQNRSIINLNEELTKENSSLIVRVENLWRRLGLQSDRIDNLSLTLAKEHKNHELTKINYNYVTTTWWYKLFTTLGL